MVLRLRLMRRTAILRSARSSSSMTCFDGRVESVLARPMHRRWRSSPSRHIARRRRQVIDAVVMTMMVVRVLRCSHCSGCVRWYGTVGGWAGWRKIRRSRLVDWVLRGVVEMLRLRLRWGVKVHARRRVRLCWWWWWRRRRVCLIFARLAVVRVRGQRTRRADYGAVVGRAHGRYGRSAGVMTSGAGAGLNVACNAGVAHRRRAWWLQDPLGPVVALSDPLAFVV